MELLTKSIREWVSMKAKTIPFVSPMQTYLYSIVPHGTNSFMAIYDTAMRIAIGKTDDINVSLCSHLAIKARERIGDEKAEKHCRVCGKDIWIVGVAKIMDYLILRHPKCPGPICLNCSETNPDDFHLAFKRGVKLFELSGGMKGLI